MPDTANYRQHDRLKDGTPVEIRALRVEDEAAMLAALNQVSQQSIQRRFFAAKRHFSDQERAFFMKVDFKTHVALVASVQDASGDTIVGGGRYVMSEPGRAEMAFVVIDAWQGRGIGSLLARHLVGLARAAGLVELTAEVLAENASMRRVFDRLGFRPARSEDPHTLRLVLKLI